jgi:hypothetical protein
MVSYKPQQRRYALVFKDGSSEAFRAEDAAHALQRARELLPEVIPRP